jgi:hypothetical protein
MDPLQRAPINQSVPLVEYDVAAADQAAGIVARTTPTID